MNSEQNKSIPCRQTIYGGGKKFPHVSIVYVHQTQQTYIGPTQAIHDVASLTDMIVDVDNPHPFRLISNCIIIPKAIYTVPYWSKLKDVKYRKIAVCTIKSILPSGKQQEVEQLLDLDMLTDPKKRRSSLYKHLACGSGAMNRLVSGKSDWLTLLRYVLEHMVSR